MTVGGFAYDWMLTHKVNALWTKMTTIVSGWNSGCRVGRNQRLVLLLLLCAGRIQFFLWLQHWPKPDKNLLRANTCALIRNCWSKPFYNKKEQNWPFNEIVNGFDEQRSTFIGETILPWSILTLHLEDLWHNKSTEVLRFITVPEYPQLYSSSQTAQCSWEIVGWWWTTTARYWWDPPLNTGAYAIWKALPVRRENRIIEVILRLLGSSSNPNKGKGWKGSCSEYIHSCMIEDNDMTYEKNLRKGDVVISHPTLLPIYRMKTKKSLEKI